MKFTTHRALRAAAPALRAALVIRSRLLAGLIAATLPLPVCGQMAATAEAGGGMARDLRVGHTVKRIVVRGSAQNEPRQVAVHLWYPADNKPFSDASKTVYKSALHGGRQLDDDIADDIPASWDPLSWTVDAEIARETEAIDPDGQAFPVIVFSSGATTDPINYAHTLELIAGAGFVVAAPYHVNNTQDDVRIDFINRQAGSRLLNCNDGRDPPCSRPSIPRSMEDRVRDVSKVLDALPGWLGDRADVSRAGVMGHSRGTLTGLAAAGGSEAWGFGPEPRVKAVMGMGIGGTLRITLQPNLDKDNLTVPTLLVAGGKDENSLPAFSKAAFDQIGCPVGQPGCADPSTEKAFVSIKNATHRSFNSNNCAQVQAAGAIVRDNPRAILDRHTLVGESPTFTGLLTHRISGKAMDYCSADTFANPTNIQPLVTSLTGFDFTTTPVPTTGLDAEEVKHGMKELATTFFGTVLKRVGNDGTHFTRYLAPKWLEKHEPMVDSAEAFAGADAICPPGQEVVCED